MPEMSPNRSVAHMATTSPVESSKVNPTRTSPCWSQCLAVAFHAVHAKSKGATADASTTLATTGTARLVTARAYPVAASASCVREGHGHERSEEGLVSEGSGC
jgi:hypothetical protein